MFTYNIYYISVYIYVYIHYLYIYITLIYTLYIIIYTNKHYTRSVNKAQQNKFLGSLYEFVKTA